MRSPWAPGVVAAAGIALAAAAPAIAPAGPAGARSGVATSSAVHELADAAVVPAVAQDTFPHVDHEGLFPFCTGCHEGVTSGDPADFYPEAASCDGCHDGVEVAAVDWTPPRVDAEPDNLLFGHPEHAREVAAAGDEALACSACHASPGASRMTVEPLAAGRCLSCHAHPGEEHVVDSDCSTCHAPLARTSLPAERLTSLPRPPSHDAPGFVLELHGEEAERATARCATCHTRDVCTSCHVGGNAEVIGRLEPVSPGLELPPVDAVYPVPPGHANPDFNVDHGESVGESGAACITCHTRDDCASCHLPPLPRGAASLPPRAGAPAPGVGLAVESPASHRTPWFAAEHATRAASDPDKCASCHTQPFCQACHDAPDRPDFHAPNYVVRHAADAWGGATECANCHQVQASCRACHAQAGLTRAGRLGPGYHDAEPVWLLRHGQAARQSLESCASCHAQRECLQCHSEVGAFQVSPHGSDFDAERARARNPRVCRVCHLGDPLGGGGGP